MNRQELQQLANLRRADAAALLREKRFGAAYYLMGYAVECALKACIAKQTRRYDFPDKQLASKAWTHNLESLMKLAGTWPDLEKDMRANRALELNWAVVKDWSEHVRYELKISKCQAQDLYSACTARTHGILSWIRQRW